MSEYLDGVARADALALQKQHHVPDLALGPPGVGDHRNALFADARHLGQAAPVVLDDLQGVLAEAVHDATGHHRAQPLDETRTQVFAYPVHRGRDLRGEPVDFELLPKSRVLGPLAVHFQNFAGDGARRLPITVTGSSRPATRTLAMVNPVSSLVNVMCSSCPEMRFGMVTPIPAGERLPGAAIRDITLDVDHRRAIPRVDGVDRYAVALDPEDAAARESDKIGPLR